MQRSIFDDSNERELLPTLDIEETAKKPRQKVPGDEPVEAPCEPVWWHMDEKYLKGEPRITTHHQRIPFGKRTVDWVGEGVDIIYEHTFFHRVVPRIAWWKLLLPAFVLDWWFNRVERWIEWRICARVWRYYTTNCGYRLLGFVECRSFWLKLWGNTEGSISGEGTIPWWEEDPDEGEPETETDDDEPDIPVEPIDDPDDEPQEAWTDVTWLCWRWSHGCKPTNFESNLSERWYYDLLQIIANDPDLTFVRAVKVVPEQKTIMLGSCVGPSGDYVYRWKVYGLRRVK